MTPAASAPARRLLCILAHPDDETLGTGGTLAKYSSEGVATFVVTATRGERGRYHDGQPRPSAEVIGHTREAELRAAAKELGVADVQVLGYPDGGLDQVDATTAIASIAGHIRRIRPQVVITFGPDGAYGHPDHVAISQIATAAIVCAADGSFVSGASDAATHRVAKLYYIAWSETTWSAYQAALKKLVVTVDGEERQATPWPRWAVTTAVDATAWWRQVWNAVSCHQTQVATFERLRQLSDDQQRSLWGMQEYYRVFSTVNGGRTRESDLFEGLP